MNLEGEHREGGGAGTEGQRGRNEAGESAEERITRRLGCMGVRDFSDPYGCGARREMREEGRARARAQHVSFSSFSLLSDTMTNTEREYRTLTAQPGPLRMPA